MGISITQLLIVLAIVVLLFGTTKIRRAGGDIGGFIRSFKSSMKGEPEPDVAAPEKIQQGEEVIEGKATREQDRVS